MARPIEIQILADADVSGVESLTDSLENAEKNLRTLADEAKDAGSDMEQYFDAAADEVKRSLEQVEREGESAFEAVSDSAKDASRDAEKDLEKVEDSLKDIADEAEDTAKVIDRDLTRALEEVEDSAKTAGRAVGKELDDGFDKAARGADEFKDEATSSARESAASFTGEFDDVADLVQETLANAFAGFGPIGAAAGLAAAVGAGYFYNKWNENAEKTEDRTSTMYEDMLESGRDYLSADLIQEEFHKIITGADDAVIAGERLNAMIRETGMTEEEVALAFAGDREMMAQVYDELNRREAEFQALLEDGIDTNDSAAQAGLDWIENMRDQATARGEEIDATAQRVEASRQILERHGYTMAENGEARREWAAAQAEADDVLADANTQIAENNETITDNSARLAENEAVLADLAGSHIDAQGALEATGAATADLTDLQYEQAEAFLNTARAAGIDEDAALDLMVAYGLIPEDVATQIRAHGASGARREAQTTRDEYSKIPRSINTTVSFSVNQWQAQQAVNAAARNLFIPTVVLPVTSQFQRPV